MNLPEFPIDCIFKEDKTISIFITIVFPSTSSVYHIAGNACRMNHLLKISKHRREYGEKIGDMIEFIDKNMGVSICYPLFKVKLGKDYKQEESSKYIFSPSCHIII